MKKYRAYFSNGSTRVIKIFDSGKFEIEDDSGFFSRITSKGKGSLKTALEVASVEVGADIKEVKEL